MRRINLLLCLLALAAAPAHAQESDPAAGSATEISAGATQPDGAPAQPTEARASGGLPQAAPPPRTLRAYWHLFGAYAIAWTLVFGYAVYLARRSGALEQQIERLEGSGA